MGCPRQNRKTKTFLDQDMFHAAQETQKFFVYFKNVSADPLGAITNGLRNSLPSSALLEPRIIGNSGLMVITYAHLKNVSGDATIPGNILNPLDEHLRGCQEKELPSATTIPEKETP